MAITRSSLIKTPARILLNGASNNYGGATTSSFFAKEDMTLKIIREQFDIKSSAYGTIDKRDKDVRVELDFTPDGQYDLTAISYLWPYANGAVTPFTNTIRGTPIFPLTTDYAAELHCGNNDKHVIQSYAVTKMPPIKFSAIESLIGAVTITGLRATNGGAIQPWLTGSSLFTTATSGGTLTDATFTPSKIVTQPYFLNWSGVTGWTVSPGIESEAGFDVSFDLKLAPDEVNSAGIINYRYDDCQVMVKFKPIGPLADQLLTAASIQGTNVLGNPVVRGQSNLALAAPLTLTGADNVTYLTIPAATLIDASYGYGALLLQNGEVGFVGSRTFSSGAQQALFTLNAAS